MMMGTVDELAPRSVAIIGSFRKHYEHVLAAIAAFGDAGWWVTSPAGTAVIDPDVDFVRFESDPVHAGDALVQSVTLEKILKAEVVYVICPGGYLGRTTCYEIGRVRQFGLPLYFSERPADLPIHVPMRNIASVKAVAMAKRHARLEDDVWDGAAIERAMVAARVTAVDEKASGSVP